MGLKIDNSGMKFLLLLSSMTVLSAQIRVIAFGAHPDDCDIRAAGTAALFKASGAAVKFVSVTNGDAGHQTMHGAELAARRLGEAKESARRLGIEYEVLDNHDGELLPTLEVRKQIIRQIRLWNADIVLAPRPNDYHPDHRYTGVLVQDAAYMVVVPHLMPEDSGAAQESGVSVLRGQFSAAESVPAGYRGGSGFGDRQENRRARFACLAIL